MIDFNNPPKYKPARPLARSLQDIIRQVLNNAVAEGIIAPKLLRSANLEIHTTGWWTKRYYWVLIVVDPEDGMTQHCIHTPNTEISQLEARSKANVAASVFGLAIEEVDYV